MRANHQRDIRLQQIRVASPCDRSWESMRGDEHVRHCDHCDLNVYNFASMTAAEVTGLLDATSGRLCGRIFRRADGTVLLRDCPAGLALVRRRLARFAILAASVLLSTFAGIAMAALTRRRDASAQAGIAHSLRHFPPFAALARWSALNEQVSAPPFPGRIIMGDVIEPAGVMGAFDVAGAGSAPE